MIIGDDEDDLADEQDDLIITTTKSEEKKKPTKAKLLQFCENIRPAYWGTWSKKSNIITSRRPWGQDVVC